MKNLEFSSGRNFASNDALHSAKKKTITFKSLKKSEDFESLRISS